MSSLNMSLKGIETQAAFEPLPPGEYVATVIDSQIKEGAKGSYIQWTWEIDNGRKVWDIMSISNDVARSRLKTMALCCGHKNPDFIADTEELHGKSCLIRLKIEQQDGYDPKNKITAFKPILKNEATPEPEKTNPFNEAPKTAKMPWE